MDKGPELVFSFLYPEGRKRKKNPFAGFVGERQPPPPPSGPNAAPAPLPGGPQVPGGGGDLLASLRKLQGG